MTNPTSLKQSIIDPLLVTARKEMENEENSGYERRVFLMVKTALDKGETAFAESLLRNFLGKFELANKLTWVNYEKPRKGNIWER